MRPITEAELHYQDALTARRELVRVYAKHLKDSEKLQMIKANIELLDKNVIPELKKEIKLVQQDYYKSPECRRQTVLIGGCLGSILMVVLAAFAEVDKNYSLTILYLLCATILALITARMFFYFKTKDTFTEMDSTETI